MSQKWIIRLMIRSELLSDEEIFWSCIGEQVQASGSSLPNPSREYSEVCNVLRRAARPPRLCQSLRNGGNGRMADGGNQNNRCPVSQEVPRRWLSSKACRSQPHSLPSTEPRSSRRALSRISSSQEDSDSLRRA